MADLFDFTKVLYPPLPISEIFTLWNVYLSLRVFLIHCVNSLLKSNVLEQTNFGSNAKGRALGYLDFVYF